jgi:hypothetical protein
MPEFGGLQIEPRCVKCGRLSTSDTLLYEMQNHHYICYTCRQRAELEGKHIAWANGTQTDGTRLISSPRPTQALPKPTEPLSSGPLARNLPPDSLFAVLEIPLETPIFQIRETLRQQMKIWATKTSDPSYKQMIARLRGWQVQLQDEVAFEEFREQLKLLVQGNVGALSIGGRAVFTAHDFRKACEELGDGWKDGVGYLRTGELWQWILFQLEDPVLSKEAQSYQKWTGVSDFRALNELLYCLDPKRPFRLYEQDSWQDVQSVPSANTPLELAKLCDLHWETAERHLYTGSMVLWLERTQHIAGLREYYSRSLAGYETDNHARDRGVGLELLLEFAVPGLEKPNLVVTFDKQISSYTLQAWDREIPHQPVTLTITNTTRGYISAFVNLQNRRDPVEPDWISFSDSFVHGTYANKEIASQQIYLQNLSSLKRGRTYRRQLLLSVRQEFGQPPQVQQFPIMLKPMRFYQGLRGKLWTFGLRGGPVGFFWHFASAALLAFLPFLLIQKLIPQEFLSSSFTEITAGTIFQRLAGGVLFAMIFLQYKFILITAGIAGFAGFWVGKKLGHTDYTAKQGAHALRLWGFWLSLIFAAILLYWDQGLAFMTQNDYYNQDAQISYFVFFIGASVLIWLLLFLIMLILAATRSKLEQFLRTHYASLMNLPGRA